MNKEEATRVIETLWKCIDEETKVELNTEQIRVAFNMAVKALQRDWIPFRQEQDPDTGLWEWAEPLPEEGQGILTAIVMEGHQPIQFDYFYSDGSGCWLDSGYDIGAEAIAWMPLPESFKEEQ